MKRCSPKPEPFALTRLSNFMPRVCELFRASILRFEHPARILFGQDACPMKHIEFLFRHFDVDSGKVFFELVHASAPMTTLLTTS